MNEFATHEQLDTALNVAVEYGHKSIRSPRVLKAFKLGKPIIYHRVNTPAPQRYPVLYSFACVRGRLFFRTFLVLEGSEGDSFAGRVADESLFYVLHSHAINRYVERHRFGGTLEEAQRTILNGLMINDVQKDGTDETMYIHFDGGIFLCTISDRVLHLRTFIMNRQCSPIQRMKSLTSEKNTKKMKREFGLK